MFILFIFLIIISCQENIPDKKENTQEKQKTPVALSDSCKYYINQSKKTDSILINASTYDEKLAIEANNLFVKTALLCNHDSISPLYLMKAAQLSQTLNKLDMSEKYLTKIINDYPKTKFIPAAKFLLAQYYADKNLLNQPEKAKQLFNEIIKDFPQSVWAENSAAALQWVGKSDEEILKQLKNKK